MAKLQQEVAQLTEEKTAAVLRAEFSEGATDAAQNELVDVTRRWARVRDGWGELRDIRTESREQPGMEAEEEAVPVNDYQLIPTRRTLLASLALPIAAAPPLNRAREITATNRTVRQHIRTNMWDRPAHIGENTGNGELGGGPLQW